MAATPGRREDDGSIGRVVWSDLRRTDLTGGVGRDFRDLYHFYLDAERRDRLEGMGRIRRTFWLAGWLLKGLLLKLSPPRRFLLLLALVFSILGRTEFQWGSGSTLQFDLHALGILVVLFVLMLELKDKLLAKDEIQVARSVQQALLPTENPELDGWELWGYSIPANDVGGDLVDYIELGGERLGVALGDVAGKGLGAALLTAKLQATLRALGPESPSLDELGDRMNAIFHQDGLDNRYATLFYLELAQGSGHVRYLNAGHNPPIVVRPDGLEHLEASSTPLGMLPGPRYAEQMLDLRDGDLLLAYSDGLSEAESPGGAEFGTANIERLARESCGISLEDAGKRILGAVRTHIEDEPLRDDLSIVLLRRISRDAPVFQ